VGNLFKSVLAQRLLRSLRPHTGIRPNWSWLNDLTEWKTVLKRSSSGPTVLVATSTGANWPCSGLESVLGVALTLRGAKVRFLLCDGVLPACQECDSQWLSEKRFVTMRVNSEICRSCYKPARYMLQPLELPLVYYSQYMNPDETLRAIPDSPAFAKHSLAGALRFYGRGTLPDGLGAERVLDRYLNAARITSSVLNRLILDNKPDIAVFHHGIYVPQGIVGEVCREAGVRVVNWGPAYRKCTVLFSHADTYHYTMIDEPAEYWNDLAWSEDKEQAIMGYLHSRWTGGNDWISFQSAAELDSSRIADWLGLERGKPIVGLLTNVIWDAQLHFRQSAFPSMLEWLFASIDYFISRPDMQWVIRVHPAEVKGTVPSRQKVADEIAVRYGSLPDHIKLVLPEDKISTYALMSLCDSALVFGTKTALELACTGLPVVVAGEAWCRGKGFTIDVSDPDQYRQVLESLPLARRLPPEQVELARKYAYHFFFRRMIPLKCLAPISRFGPYKVNVTRLEQLMPGADPGLDLICDGILNGKPFIYDT